MIGLGSDKNSKKECQFCLGGQRKYNVSSKEECKCWLGVQRKYNVNSKEECKYWVRMQCKCWVVGLLLRPAFAFQFTHRLCLDLSCHCQFMPWSLWWWQCWWLWWWQYWLLWWWQCWWWVGWRSKLPSGPTSIFPDIVNSCDDDDDKLLVLSIC